MNRRTPLLVAMALLAVAPSAAAAAEPSLHDVWFQVFWEPQPTDGRTSGTCEPDGTSTVHFAVDGFAQGSIAGAVHEEGTIEIGPHTLGPVPEDETHWHGTFGLAAARPVTWSSEFSLTLPDGTQVHGTKTGAEVLPYDVALCHPGAEQSVGYRRYARVINLDYNATFTRAGETTTEQGTSEVNLREAYLDGAPGARVGQYRTTFAAAGVLPIAEPAGLPLDATVTTDEEPNGQGPGGDGATEADPVEATLEESTGDDTTIAEDNEPEAEASAKTRLRRLGQRVRIRTPKRSAAVRLRFEIDSTARRSAGPRKLVVRRNGRTVPACGHGAPTCVERRATSGGDDALLVVRGRALAGTWTFLAPRKR